MMETIIPLIIIIAVVFLAVRYIVKSKKRGDKCIGCPVQGTCQKKAKKYDIITNRSE